jgi:hypothetical protein
MGLYISVTNPSPTVGGSDRVSAAPTSEDYDALADRLLSALWETALEEAQAGLQPNDIILNTAPREISIIEETYSPNEPQPSPNLSLLQRVEFNLFVVSWHTFEEMINSTLDATLPERFSPIQDSLEITSLSMPEFQEDNSAVWEIRAEREIFTLENTEAAINGIRGMRTEEAKNYLKQIIPLKSTPEIHVAPSWWFWLPFLEMRITVHN